MNETLILADTVPFLIPLFEKIRLVILSLQWMVGGIFGLYVILIFLRWKESIAVKKILKEIRDDIKELTIDIRLVNGRVEDITNKKKKK